MQNAKTLNLDEWAPVMDGDLLHFEGNEPTVVTLRSFGASAVYLDAGTGNDLLLGVGDSAEYTVTLNLPEPHALRVVLEAASLPAAFRARVSNHTQRDMSEEPSVVVIKPRIQQSEEMRMMMRMLHEQNARHERQLKELHDANPARFDRRDTGGATRDLVAGGKLDRAPEAGTASGLGENPPAEAGGPGSEPSPS